MKRSSGNFAAIFINNSDAACSVYGTFEIYPANTVGMPLKNYHSGKVSCKVKNVDSQEVIDSFSHITLKIVGDTWSIGTEPATRQWTSFTGEPYDTILSQVKEEYYSLYPE